MRRVFLFNPENDIALASGLPRITAPLQGRLLHQAGAMLPYWLGDEDDLVLVPSDKMESCRIWRDTFHIEGPQPVDSLAVDCGYEPVPWGWSLDACAQFENAGMEPALFSSRRAIMEAHRALSHRRTSLRLLNFLKNRGVEIPAPLPAEAFTAGEVEMFVRTYGVAYIKSPWSSSGRGVFPVSTATLPVSLPRIEGIIRRQGSVMAEPVLPKLQDFAMLYDYAPGNARFVGYSMFFNSNSTNYGGNIVASDEEILCRLSSMTSPGEIEFIRDAVADALADALMDGYRGPLGVDMMIYGDERGYRKIAPCIELNLRFTMGFVARGVYGKTARRGVMSVSPKRAGISPGGVGLVPENPYFDFILSKIPSTQV